MRRFVLDRHTDQTGISGTGVVAEGVQFADGTVALRWAGRWPSSVAFYQGGVGAVNAVHGHDGSTQLVWLDPLEDLELPSLQDVTPPA